MFSFVDKNGRTVEVTATIPNQGLQAGQGFSHLSAEEIVRALLNKYVPASEFITRP